MSGKSKFVFLNVSKELSEIGWEGFGCEELWRYNLHYFDDLNALNASERKQWHADLIEDWIIRNPPGSSIGWEPYPLSLRVINWLKWAMSGNQLSRSAAQSIAVQVRWLTKRLEFHLLGNHLFSNGKALVFAGMFFQGKEASRWLDKGLKILAQELPEQVLCDGGHFERSTMYHALALEDLLDLLNIANVFISSLTDRQKKIIFDFRQRAIDMYAWLLGMCHLDGEISFFNDSAFDIAPSIKELSGYAQRLLRKAIPLPQNGILRYQVSGYIRLQSKDALALLDVAPVGPDYLPAHAHADTLSFELSIAGRRILVNSGTSCYGNSAERMRQRGTASHNTVIINGNDSSEVWGGFRVARRAYPMELNVTQNVASSLMEVSCAHNGYAHLPGRPIHRRTWLMDDDSLIVLDQIEGKYTAGEARFHFHPDMTIEVDDAGSSGIAISLDGFLVRWSVGYGRASIESSTWHPRFGCAVPNYCLVVSLVSSKGRVRFDWHVS